MDIKNYFEFHGYHYIKSDFCDPEKSLKLKNFIYEISRGKESGKYPLLQRHFNYIYTTISYGYTIYNGEGLLNIITIEKMIEDYRFQNGNETKYSCNVCGFAHSREFHDFKKCQEYLLKIFTLVKNIIDECSKSIR